MQKQLVLAALFATAHAVTDCTDANVELVRARKKAIVDALAGTDGLTAAKTAATTAKTATDTAQTAANTEYDAWTTAMSTYTTEHNAQVTEKSNNDSAYTTAKANADAMATEGCYAVSTSVPPVVVAACAAASANAIANALLPLKIAEQAKDDAAALLLVGAALAAGAVPVTAQAKLNKANSNVTALTTNETDHETVRVAKLGLQTTAKTNWDTGLAAIGTCQDTLKAEKLKRAVDANILVANVDQTTAAAVMRTAHASGIGHASGTAYTAGATDAAAFYAAEYLNHASAPTGYAKLREAAVVISDGATYTTYINAQKALEKQAMIFGKIKYACQTGASWAAIASNKQTEPCLRTGGFEKALYDNYNGTKGTAGAFPANLAINSGADTGKAGDVAADGGAGVNYTSASAIAAFVKGYAATAAGTAATGAGTTTQLPRDTAYDAWYLKIVDSAATQVTEERALVQHRILLKRAEAAWTWTTTDTASAANAATDVIRASSAGDYATYVDTSDGFLTTFKIKSTALGKSYSAPNAVARSGTMTYFEQLSRTINVAYNDIIVKRVALGTGAAAAGTQAAMTLSAMQTLGGAGLTQAIVTAASGLTEDYLQASLNLNLAVADKTQATADKNRAILVQTACNTKIKSLNTDLTIKTYLFNNKKADYDVQVTAYKLADAKKALFLEAKTASDAIGTTANAKKVFYAKVQAKANLAANAANTAYTNADNAITNNTSAKTAIDLEETKAVADCKARGYKQAQDTLKSISSKQTADAATALTVKTAYDALVAASRPAAVAEGSAAGADCAYPAAGADGAVAARPKCAAELCCGAANKYLKDGSKLTVETCQATAATSYTYYPQLRAGATVAPATEQWRFSCVAGAKNLAATATAALAAAYLMA